jgi:lipopolysaccharide O-acetyltransferase
MGFKIVSFSSFCGYSLFSVLKLAYYLVFTKIFFSCARLIRMPIYLRGKSRISFGHRLTTGRFNRIEALPQDKSKQPIITFGDNVQINDSNHIAGIRCISIGNNVLIASRVFISDHNHGNFDCNSIEEGPDMPPAHRSLHAKPVRIGNNVWIGESVCVLPGVTIGDGAVIGAGSVVTRDIPARCVAAGNPARVIRQWDDATHEWRRI